jgi:predicted peptidase
MSKQIINNIISLTEIFQEGQKIVGVAIEYATLISETAVSLTDYTIKDRTITTLHVSDSARGAMKTKGRFVVLTLDSKEPKASTKELIGGPGPGSRMKVLPAEVLVSQRNTIKAVNGEELPAFIELKNDLVDNGILDRFSVHTFQVPNSELQLSYNLYMPKKVLSGQKYPLVLFMHDAGSCSDDVSATLTQGSGAVVWARDAELGTRPCFVVAPHYPTTCANDDFEVTWHTDATIELMKYLSKNFPIDKSRIYGTGQSMGCMMLCEMLLRYPGFFAGSLLVAGQWNPQRMPVAKEAKIWSIVAAGDAKAYPIMGACFANMKKAGGKLSRGHIDATAPSSVINQQIYSQKSLGCNLNFTWYEGKSILPPGVPDHPGMHHIYTWTKAYDIVALREWLFEQRISMKSKKRKDCLCLI